MDEKNFSEIDKKEEEKLHKDSKNLKNTVDVINIKVTEQNIILEDINTTNFNNRINIEDQKNLLLKTMKEIRRDGRTMIIVILVVVMVTFTYFLI